MYRVPAIAALLAAAAFPPSLAGQMRTIQRPSGPVQANVSRFPVLPPSGGLGVMSPRSFGRRASLVRPVPFPHNLRFSISFGSTCFTDPLFDPVLCQQLLSRNQFLFAQPVFLPFPGYTMPYYQAEQNAPTVVDREGDLAREVDRLTNEVELLRAPQAAPEPLLLEWHGDHWVRVTSYGQSVTGAQPDYSERSHGRSAPSERSSALQSPRELPPVALVFRDGRKEEVSSYTIVGGTMYAKANYWTSGSWTKEIRIADLDVPATVRLNQERGVKFALPAAPYEVVMR
jgi:hypothetical protein